MTPAARTLHVAPEGPPLPRVADVIVRTFAELGVGTFYGVPGGAICSMYDALIDSELRVVNARHETGAVYMAMGHHRAGGPLPGILLTSGPGITNALTGLAAANADGIPLIALGGEVPRRNYGRGALQEGSRYHLDVLSMVRSVTKFSAEITHANAAAPLVRKAVATALSGRQGPVFLSLPLDVANERITSQHSSIGARLEFDLDVKAVEEAARAIAGAKRPMLLLGSGSRGPEAVREVMTLATRVGIPVATTPKGKGLFPESHPLSLGVFGFGGHPSASAYLEAGADVVLCVGSGLGETSTNSWSPILQAKTTFIQIDIDAAQLGRNYRVDIGLVGPAAAVLGALNARLRDAEPKNREGLGVRYVDSERNEGLLHPADIIEGLQRVFGSRAIFTADIGEHTIFALHHLRIDEPDGFIVATGLGAMGSGIGAAVGAKVARPDRPVVAICGDYGFQMHGMELSTCVQERVGVVFAVFNDARMRMVESGLLRIFGRTSPMDGPRVDFAAMARSLGATGISIRTDDDLRALTLDALEPGVPCVLDIHVDPTAAFPNHGRIAQIKNFSA